MNISEEISKLIDAKVFKPDAAIRWGEITGLSPTLVRFSGDTEDVEVERYLGSYTPVENDRVVLLKVGSAWVILGEVL
jgi:hypothetical protein